MNLPAHALTMTVLMTPDMANFSGNVHGGTVLKFLDQVMFRQPVAVPPLRPVSVAQLRRHAAAHMRKQLRQEFGKRFEALRSAASS